MRLLFHVVLCIALAALVFGCAQEAAPEDEAPSATNSTATDGSAKKAAQPAPAKPKSKPVAKTKPTAKPAAKSKPMKVVKEWDFTKLEVGKWEWTGRGKQLHEAKVGGAYLDLDRDGAGPVLRGANVPADGVGAVRATFSLDIRGDGRVTRVDPDRVTLLWARSEDGKPGQNWPFSGKRLKHSDKPRPRRRAKAYRFDVAGHPGWNGQIEGLCVTIDVPEGKLKEGESFRIILHKIEFLK